MAFILCFQPPIGILTLAQVEKRSKPPHTYGIYLTLLLSSSPEPMCTVIYVHKHSLFLTLSFSYPSFPSTVCVCVRVCV